MVSAARSRRWVAVARELQFSLILDEFYSHYVWRPDLVARGGIETAARYVEDVDRDPVVILDGLTKNWRYPGWRVTWTVAPKRIIEGVTSAGSFLDGGGSRPLQRKAIDLLAPTAAMAETRAIQAEFGKKRARLLNGLRDLGFTVDLPARGHVLRVGVGRAPAAVDQRRHVILSAPRSIARSSRCPASSSTSIPASVARRRVSRFRRHLRFSFGRRCALDLALERFAN
jgi:DNA-binding transcriptional MocR family regulator